MQELAVWDRGRAGGTGRLAFATLVVVVISAPGCGRAARPDPEIVTINADTIPTCSACSIRMELLGAFGSVSDSVLLSATPKLTSFGNRLIAYVPNGNIEILLYGAQHGGVPIGRLGEGPGEYQSVQAVATTEDTIYVMHDRNRISVFDGQGEFVRDIVSSMVLRGPLLISGAGQYTVGGLTGAFRAAIEESRPLHVLDSVGAVLRSFGPQPILRTLSADWVLAERSSSRGLWIAEVGSNYLIYEVDQQGRVLRIIVRESPHDFYLFAFPNRAFLDSLISVHGDQPDITSKLTSRAKRYPTIPPPSITGIFDDGRYLWVSMNVPAPNWREVEMRYGESGTTPTDDSMNELYRAIVEVVDSRSGTLIARTEASGTGMILSDGSFGRTFYDKSGVVRVEWFRLELVNAQTLEAK